MKHLNIYRVVKGRLGLPTPSTLLHNAMINVFNNIITCVGHNTVCWCVLY